MADRITQLKALLEAEPGDAFCMYGLAIEHAKIGDHATAIRWFDQALVSDPRLFYSYFHKARSQIASDDHSGARETLSKGLDGARRAGDLKAASELAALLDEVTD